MKLEAVVKNGLLQAISKVHAHYSALELLNENFKIAEHNNYSLIQYLRTKLPNLAAGSEHLENITINNIPCRIILRKDLQNAISFKLQLNDSAPIENSRKPLPYKTVQEKLNHICQFDFTLTPNNDNEYIAGTTLNINQKSYAIGGGAKYPLYKSHLDNLAKIYEHINTDRDIKNILIALATGSGKTFIQALWLLVLETAGMDGIFALPKNLVKQFELDLRKLLPDELVNEIYLLDPELMDKPINSIEHDAEVIKNLGNKENLARKRFMIASYEKLLDNNYHNLTEVKGNIFFSFDEQHRITQNESRKLKLEELAKKYLFISLTATPDKITYQYSGGKPVATLSNKQKAAQNQGNLPTFLTIEAKTIRDKLDAISNPELKNTMNKLKLKSADAIQKQLASPAVSLVEELPYLTVQQNGAIHRPAGNKLLVLVDDLNEMINLNNAIRNEENYNKNDKYFLERREKFGNKKIPFIKNSQVAIYSEGNKKDRNIIYECLNIEEIVPHRNSNSSSIVNIETKIQASFHQQLEENFKKKVSEAPLTMRAQLERNIYQGLMEFYWRYVTGLSTIQLNEYRKNNLDALIRLVKDKYEAIPYLVNDLIFQENLRLNGIDEEGAANIASLIFKLHKFARNSNTTRDEFIALLINDSLKPDLENFINKYPYQKDFKQFAGKHLMLFMVDGLVQNGNKPFSHFEETLLYRYAPDGSLEKWAKKRRTEITENLNRFCWEYFYDPVNLNFDEKTADAYFKQGFIGMYVSNKKTEGFNDPNLATTVQIIPDEANSLNSPAQTIQAAGRCRGLDETKAPIVIQAIGKGVKPLFHLEKNLNKTDYFPEYYNSLEKYNQIHLIALSKQIKNEIVEWIRVNGSSKKQIREVINGVIEIKEVIVNINIKKQDLGTAIQTIFTNAIRQVNNDNNHAIIKTHNQIKLLTKLVHKELKDEIEFIKKPYSIKSIVKITGYIIYAFTKTKLAINDFVNKFKLNFIYYKNKIKSIFTRGLKQPDIKSKSGMTYLKILKNTSRESITKYGVHLANFSVFLLEENGRFISLVKSAMTKYLTDSAQRQINYIAKAKLLPSLAKWCIGDNENKIMNAGINYNKWYILLLEFEKELSMLGEAINNANAGSRNNVSAEERKKIVLKILKRLPELNQLELEDIQDFPSIIEKKETVIAEFDKQVKNSFSLFSRIEKFMALIHHFIAEKDYPKIKEIFSNEQNCQEWGDILFATMNIANGIDKNKFIHTFKTFVQSKDATLSSMVTMLEYLNMGDKLFEPLMNLLASIKENPVLHLRKEKHDKLNDIVNRELADAFVKFYNPSTQDVIKNAICLNKNWAKFLFENKDKFIDLAQASGDTRGVKLKIILRSMIKTLEDQGHLADGYAQTQERNLKTASEESVAAIVKIANKKAQPTQIAKAGLSAGWSQFKGFVTRSKGNQLTIEQETIANILASIFQKNKFIEKLEPMFTNPNHLLIKEKIGNSENANLFSKALVKKFNIKDMKDLTGKNPQEVAYMFVTTFNDCFNVNPPLKSLDSSLEEGFKSLDAQVNIENMSSAEKVRYLCEEDIQVINYEMKNKFLVLIMKWLTPEAAGKIGGVANEFKKWPELLLDLLPKFMAIQNIISKDKIERLLFEDNDEAKKKLLELENHLKNFVHAIFDYLLNKSDNPLKIYSHDMINYFQVIKNTENEMESLIKKGLDKEYLVNVLNSYLMELGLNSLYYAFDGRNLNKLDCNYVPKPVNHYSKLQYRLLTIDPVTCKQIKDEIITQLLTLIPFYLPPPYADQFKQVIHATSDWHWLIVPMKEKLDHLPNIGFDEQNKQIFDLLIHIFKERNLLSRKFPRESLNLAKNMEESSQLPTLIQRMATVENEQSLLYQANVRLSESEAFQQKLQSNQNQFITSSQDKKFANIITNYLISSKDTNLSLMKFDELFKFTLLEGKPVNDLILSVNQLLDYGTFQIKNIRENYKEHIDNNKLNILFRNAIMPALSHPLFAQSFKYAISYLSKSDLETILSVLNPNSGNLLLVDNILDFMKLLNEGRYKEIYARYFDLRHINFKSAVSEEESIKTCSGMKILNALMIIFDEVRNCQNHFYRNASPVDQNIQPVISSQLAKAADVSVSNIRSNATEIDKQFLYLSGTTDAIKTTNSIQVLGQRSLLKTLDYADKFITYLSKKLSKASTEEATLPDGHEDVYLATNFLNTFKKLKPMSSADILKSTCPQDAVETLVEKTKVDPNILILEAYEQKVLKEIINIHNKNQKYNFSHPEGVFTLNYQDAVYSIPFSVAHPQHSQPDAKVRLQAEYYNALIDLLSIFSNNTLTPEKRLKTFRKELQQCNILYFPFITKNFNSTLFSKKPVPYNPVLRSSPKINKN